MDEHRKRILAKQLVEIGARLASSRASTLDAADPKPTSDESVELDTSCGDVATGGAGWQVELVRRRDPLELLGIDDGQLIAVPMDGRPVTGAGCVAIATQPDTRDRSGSRNGLHRLTGGFGDVNELDTTVPNHDFSAATHRTRH